MPAENMVTAPESPTVPITLGGNFRGQLTDAATPPPPPPMPETGTPARPPAMPTPADPEKPTTMVAAADQQQEQPQATGGWQVDPHELRSFGDAVVRARAYLDAVQAKVDRMQGAELTPQLGTSPVGQQLAKKFDDRLNSADGLRAMLAEAMKRMDDFVTSAETAARGYEDHEESTVDTFSKHHHHHDHSSVNNGG